MRLCKRCGGIATVKNKRLCNKCKYIAEKERDPIGLAYRRLKSRAKVRGKEFTLTKEQFAEFCAKSEYIDKRGIHKNCYHIDRKDETKGYSIGNIQVLSNSDNVRKYARWVSRNSNGKSEFTTETTGIDRQNMYDDDLPF